MLALWDSGESLGLACSAASSLRLHGEEEHAGFSFYKGANPIMRAPPMSTSKPHDLPTAPPPNTITLAARASTYDFGEHRHSVHNKTTWKIPATGGTVHSICHSRCARNGILAVLGQNHLKPALSTRQTLPGGEQAQRTPVGQEQRGSRAPYSPQVQIQAPGPVTFDKCRLVV